MLSKLMENYIAFSPLSFQKQITDKSDWSIFHCMGGTHPSRKTQNQNKQLSNITDHFSIGSWIEVPMYFGLCTKKTCRAYKDPVPPSSIYHYKLWLISAHRMTRHLHDNTHRDRHQRWSRLPALLLQIGYYFFFKLEMVKYMHVKQSNFNQSNS